MMYAENLRVPAPAGAVTRGVSFILPVNKLEHVVGCAGLVIHAWVSPGQKWEERYCETIQTKYKEHDP